MSAVNGSIAKIRIERLRQWWPSSLENVRSPVSNDRAAFVC